MAQQKKENRRGVTAAAVGVGLAGAVAGATVGVAFADEKTRRKIVKLAQDARDAFQRLMTELEDRAQDQVDVLPELGEVRDTVEKKIKKATKHAKEKISRRT